MWNSKVTYLVPKSPPLNPHLSQYNPVHSFTTYFLPIHFNIVDFSLLGYNRGETLVNIYNTKRRHNLEDNLQLHRRDSLKSHGKF
jgi:hypothetical protein